MGGGHWPRKGEWGCAALTIPFSRLSCSLQGSHFKQKSQLSSLQIWKFSVHKPPSFRGKYQFASPTLQKSGLHTPTWKKISAPTPPPHPPTGVKSGSNLEPCPNCIAHGMPWPCNGLHSNFNFMKYHIGAIKVLVILLHTALVDYVHGAGQVHWH